MWIDIIEYIFSATKNGKNVLYMEADTLLFKNCDEILKSYRNKNNKITKKSRTHLKNNRLMF